jgi:hydrogenase-4 component E
MHPAAASTTFSGATEGLAALILLTEFAMLRSAMLRSQVRLYAVQSLVVTALVAVVAGARGIPELFILAGLTFALKVVLIPSIVFRVMRESKVDLAGSHRLNVATMIFIGISVSVFGFLSVNSLDIHSATLPTPALGTAVAVVLVSFVVIILRGDVVSQAVGFFSLENGVSVASLVIAAGLPFIVEVAFLVDLLVAVVVFGVLMRVHQIRAKTLSTDVLDRLKG